MGGERLSRLNPAAARAPPAACPALTATAGAWFGLAPASARSTKLWLVRVGCTALQHTTGIARRLNLGHLPTLGLAELLPGAQQPSPASSAAGSRRGSKDGGARGAKGEAAAAPIAAAAPAVRAD